ncbi:hypothetical protein QJS04_geneDACA023293 [Acorus gramineus]|uniref:Uncharacterized protein n=1 Tax=Acorus gramineus TaxID=55184 RepID=A0AAV9BST5_ACOGR|nr:hypothetical protein QJS04_geneDACA023293 [Acorus gramineus]
MPAQPSSVGSHAPIVPPDLTSVPPPHPLPHPRYPPQISSPEPSLVSTGVVVSAPDNVVSLREGGPIVFAPSSSPVPVGSFGVPMPLQPGCLWWFLVAPWLLLRKERWLLLILLLQSNLPLVILVALLMVFFQPPLQYPNQDLPQMRNLELFDREITK